MIFQLANLCSNIKNACGNNFVKTTILKNRKSLKIIQILYTEGYISNYKILKNDKIEVYLKYINNIPLLKKDKIILISKPSKRVYLSNKQLIDLYSRHYNALHIISTPFGIMSLKKALQIRQGGEYLLKVVV